jgi:ABC-type antimicrobial peptide transport system permease subunit
VGKDPKAHYIFSKFQADHDFTRTMGLTVLTGRDINVNQYSEDSTSVLLNSTAVKLMGFDNPLGQTIRNSEGNWRVVGVVNDFVPGDAYEPIQPVVIHGTKGAGFGVLSLRMNEKSEEYLKKIRDIFKKYNPDYPFDYKMVTDAQGEQFQEARHLGILAAAFAGLTIFISCLGLFALAAYMAENRITEIGVRKVLGASVSGITALLSKDFMKLVLIAFVIASPLAAWAMYAWLRGFPYHIEISWWIFALAGLLTGLIALVTVSSQAIRAALTNPAKSLRTE